MSDTNSERTVYWYYRLGDKEWGPVLVSRLRQLAHSGKLTSSDFVRKGKYGPWMAADSITEIGAKPRIVDEVIDSSTLCDTRSNSASVSANDIVEFATRLVTDHLSIIWWTVADHIVLARKIAGYFALVAIIAVGLRMVAMSHVFDRPASSNSYQTCQTLWAELRQLRADHANDAAWGEFVERGSAQLRIIVGRLKREASSDDREKQMLLWASRDCLPQMFLDAREAVSQAELSLGEYLENCDRLRAGESIYGGSKVAYFERLQKEHSAYSWLKDEPLVMSTAILLTVANGTVVIWFISRFIRHASKDS